MVPAIYIHVGKCTKLSLKMRAPLINMIVAVPRVLAMETYKSFYYIHTVGGLIPGTFGAELAKRPGSSSSDKGNTNHYHSRVGAMSEGTRGGEDDDQEDGVSGTVEELFSGSLLPPVQLPLDYSTHVKQRTLVAKTKVVKKIKQEPVEEMDTSESSSVLTSKLVARPTATTPVSEVKGHGETTAAELFTPTEVYNNYRKDVVVPKISFSEYSFFQFSRIRRGSSYSFSFLIVSPFPWQLGRVPTNQWRVKRALELTPSPLQPEVLVPTIQRYVTMLVRFLFPRPIIFLVYILILCSTLSTLLFASTNFSNF